MPYAIQIKETGGPEVMQAIDTETLEPGAGEIRIAQSAIGLNFIDTYHRTGLYPVPLPAVLGMEAAGTVDAVGDGVSGISTGDRVAYAGGGVGAYTDSRIINAGSVVKIPDSLSDEAAAALMLKGFTATYLIHRTYQAQKGDTVLLQAAAGGVGLIACQILKQTGATVIGTVGNKEKADLARAHGCDHPVIYTEENFKDRLLEITDGKGVPVVYDSVGASTFEDSLDCLAPFGTFVSFGNASGPVPPFNPGILSQKGSLYFTRPTLMSHIATPEQIAELAGWLFGYVENGLKIEVNQKFPLKDATAAHVALENRETTGSTVFLP
ncbi:MAG TPA: quinone oxidoreductase [Rhodospirillaceae bacterium]|nr:quinone oxidoreductase [Rhodospirillaceae bacterium]HAA91160.1 quinone oxidoreductase [Rhodospirillaceae bacterium]HAT34487.1 quinone oxidoreductase [Rhodospirillaceae bacterium]